MAVVGRELLTDRECVATRAVPFGLNVAVSAEPSMAKMTSMYRSDKISGCKGIFCGSTPLSTSMKTVEFEFEFCRDCLEDSTRKGNVQYFNLVPPSKHCTSHPSRPLRYERTLRTKVSCETICHVPDYRRVSSFSSFSTPSNEASQAMLMTGANHGKQHTIMCRAFGRSSGNYSKRAPNAPHFHSSHGYNLRCSGFNLWTSSPYTCPVASTDFNGV